MARVWLAGLRRKQAGTSREISRLEAPNCFFLTRGFTRRHTKLRLSAREMEKEKNMAAKVETLRITARPNTTKRPIFARFADTTRDWARKGQLGPTSTSEMRRYTGAR